jgi:hypothetical protein
MGILNYDIEQITLYEHQFSIPYMTDNTVGGVIVNNIYNYSDDSRPSIEHISRRYTSKIQYDSTEYTDMRGCSMFFEDKNIVNITTNQRYRRYNDHIMRRIYMM